MTDRLAARAAEIAPQLSPKEQNWLLMGGRYLPIDKVALRDLRTLFELSRFGETFVEKGTQTLSPLGAVLAAQIAAARGLTPMQST